MIFRDALIHFSASGDNLLLLTYLKKWVFQENVLSTILYYFSLHMEHNLFYSALIFCLSTYTLHTHAHCLKKMLTRI